MIPLDYKLFIKSMAEFEKNIGYAMSKANEHNLIKSHQVTHFLFELNKMYKFLGYADLLKHLFKIISTLEQILVSSLSPSLFFDLVNNTLLSEQIIGLSGSLLFEQ